MRVALSLLLAAVCLAVAEKRAVSYVTNWAQYRDRNIGDGINCKFTMDMVEASHVTHINYAFAKMNSSYNVVHVEWNDDQMIPKLQAKKLQNPKLKTLVSIGGWNFNVFNSTKHLFSNMIETKESRTHFIQSAISYCRTWEFDGFDIDWEYPGWEEQGGRDIDKANFPLLLKEMMEAFVAEAQTSGKARLLLTIAAPAGDDKIEKGYDLPNIHPHLDWINLMTYDLHGSADSVTGPHTALRNPNGDKLTADHAVATYRSAGVPADKLVLGLATYGRTWTLKDPSQHGYGAPVKAGEDGLAPGAAGGCTQEAGFLAEYEIEDFVLKGATMVVDNATSTAYAYKDDQFVTFDTLETHAAKTQYICDNGLGGAMVWAMDLERNFTLQKAIYDKVVAGSCSGSATDSSSGPAPRSDPHSSSHSDPSPHSGPRSSSHSVPISNSGPAPHSDPTPRPAPGDSSGAAGALCASAMAAVLATLLAL
eukprot:m51a1_g1230 putative chitotriosidase-1 (478) ;mRNA; r:527908-529341